MFAKPPVIVEMTVPVSNEEESQNPITRQVSVQEAVEIKSRDTIQYGCLREFIVANHNVYRFCAITGILTPVTGDNQKNSLTKHNIRFRFWYLYLHLFYLFGFFFFMVEGVESMVFDPQYDLLLFCEYFGVALQLILIVPVVLFLRYEINTKREIDEVLYIEAFSHGIKLARRVFVVLIVLSFIFYAFAVVYLPASGGVKFLYFLVYTVVLSPLSFFLTGIMAFLIVEQRISLRTMERVRARAQEERLTHEEYFEARESIDSRDRLTPLSIIAFTALLNMLFCFLLMFAIKRKIHTKAGVIFNIIYVLSNFGKQPVVVAAILKEIVKVNEIAEKMIAFISRYRWFATDSSDSNRVSLYIATKEYPIGSTIFYMRPTKFQVYVQVFSLMFGVGSAVFWALVFA